MSINELYRFFLEGWGWIAFALIAILLTILVLIDTNRRKVPAITWITGLILCSLFFVPVAIYAFSSSEVRDSMQDFRAFLFYLGITAGIAPIFISIGYWITNRGYKASISSSQNANYVPLPPINPNLQKTHTAPPIPTMAPPPIPLINPSMPNNPPKKKLNAWLVDSFDNSKNFQLLDDETRVGRHPDYNDLAFPENLQVSKEHFKIKYINGHYVLVDLGSTSGTFVNGLRLTQEYSLRSNDLIQFGDRQIRFVN